MISKYRGITAWVGVILITAATAAVVLGYRVEEYGRVYKVDFVPFAAYSEHILCLLKACPTAQESLRFVVLNGIGNIALFIPLGLALGTALINRKLPVLIGTAFGFLVSTGIEIVQFFRPGRIASLGDIYMNTLGTSIGILLFLVLLRPLVDSIWTLRHQYE